MKVRACFTLNEKIQTRDGYRLTFAAVHGGNKETEQFFKYTPYGSLEMGTINDDAAASFDVGEDYYLDFTVASPCTA